MRPSWLEFLNWSPEVNPVFSSSASAQLRHKKVSVEEADYSATGDLHMLPTDPPVHSIGHVAPPGGASPGLVFKGAGDEITGLLGASVMSGNLQLEAVTRGNKVWGWGRRAAADTWAVLTQDEFSLGSGHSVLMTDVVAVSCCEHSCQLVVHAFPAHCPCWAPPPLHRSRRVESSFRLVAPTVESAWQWVAAFARLACFVNVQSAHNWPLERERGAKAGHAALDPEVGGGVPSILFPARRKVVVVLNPRSGHGKAVRIFHRKVRPILEVAGFAMTVIETNAPKHAVQIAAQLDLATCPDGIICVGGDGIVNEVLNGLYQRPDAAEALAVPVGVVPAGSDNSLVWSVLGIADPVSGAVAIVKGGTVEADALVLQWGESGRQCVGHTIAYFGFMSDVLSLSQRYQPYCGPLRYLAAGFVRLLRLPSFDFDVHFLPIPDAEVASEGEGPGRVDPLFKALRGSGWVGGKQSPPASPLLSGEEDVSTPHSTPSPRARPRSKARAGGKLRGWVPLEGSPEQDPAWGGLVRSLSEGSVSDRGVGDAERGLEFSELSDREGEGGEGRSGRGGEGSKWVVRRGPYFAIMACNHSCSSVQCLESQQLAPNASAEDGGLGLLLVRPVGRLQVIQFLVMMQFGRHVELPFVELVRVLALRVVPRSATSRCCGVDGELWPLEEPVLAGVLHHKCRFIGRPRAKG